MGEDEENRRVRGRIWMYKRYKENNMHQRKQSNQGRVQKAVMNRADTSVGLQNHTDTDIKHAYALCLETGYRKVRGGTTYL